MNPWVIDSNESCRRLEKAMRVAKFISLEEGRRKSIRTRAAPFSPTLEGPKFWLSVAAEMHLD